MRPFTATIWAVVIAVAAVGCSGSTTSTGETDEEHEHHHHHEAEHRPRNFPDAVQKAGLRHRGVLWELDHGHGDRPEFVHEFEEFLDVVDWLPEFAADSDMRKAPWDRVHEAAMQLRTAHAVVERKLAAGETPTPADVNVTAADSAIEELESLVGTEKGDRP